ncbi:prenylated Rab acceptor protein 1 [Condylostylus longicornis]|uniref:prenylated Rab acceptor protein 1 n=1 Tax=Condylostylus longicornis TaxID=2530218 RepID=UPI00244E5B23|nr:prenylated Rab acceptor protein 1 [Condylostylus longicornis]XP_055380429.1 prenylated Rab acceptor protein 1 [Condylostylus longicornis]
MDVKVDVSGDMEAPAPANSKGGFSFTNMSNLSSTLAPLEILKQIRVQLRPWSEFLNTQNFKTIASFQRLTGRLIRNLAYFQSNYLCVFIVLMLYCLITSPLILIVLCGAFYITYRIKKADTTVQVFGRQINSYQQGIIVNIAAAPVLYIAGAGAIIFWVIGASCFVISLHAAFYNIDAIVTEDTEGFLSEVV